METNIFSIPIDLSLKDRLLAHLKEQNFDFATPPPLYTIFSAKKKGISITLYQTGKLLVQGKEAKNFIEFYLEPQILKTFQHTYPEAFIEDYPRIGIDESGKGDFFGPLCVAGVYASGGDLLKLKHLGVKDSKKLSDKSISCIAEKIMGQFCYHIIKINPQRYNQMYNSFQNLNHLLAWGHSTAIEQLVIKTNCHYVIIDQFASENVMLNALKKKQIPVELHQRHRAEEDLVVAAASILARDAFIKGLKELGNKVSIDLPKGANAEVLRVGKELVAQYGEEILPKVAKMHFKTLDAIIDKTHN